MESRNPISLKKRIQSFGYAINGLWRFIKTEHNLWIQCVIAIIAILLGFLLQISQMEWVAIIIVIGMAISAEAFNTSIEKAMDYLAPEGHENVKYIKDLAAGAVLISAIVAAIVGIIIFLPKIIALF